MPEASVVIACPYCGHPYPLTPLQREVYRGRNMGCMNCGRPFKVDAAPQRAIDAPAEPGFPAAARDASAGAEASPAGSASAVA